MRGISKKELEDMLRAEGRLDIKFALNFIIQQCRELDPWMPIDEFLKSKFIGACWICTREKEIIECNFNGVVFSYGRRSIISVIFVTHVQPSHKPEPPQDD